MTNYIQKNIFKNCHLILEKLCSKEIQSILVDSGEYVNKIFDSFTTGQLQKEIGISYESLFDSIGLLIENKHIQTTTPLNNDNVVQIVLNTEKTKCEISQKGYEAFRYGFYRKLILDIEYSETLKENNKNQHQSILDTNESVKKTNTIQKYTLISTGLIALMACIFQGLTYCLEHNKNKSTINQKLTDSLIIEIKNKLKSQDEIYLSLSKKIDSLTKTK